MLAIESCVGARLVAISDVQEDRARQIGEEKGILWYTDYRRMLENQDIDVVCVCTPSGMRGRICIDVARSGRHIFAEKPLEITLEKVDAVIRECDHAGVKFAGIFQNRFFTGVKTFKETVDA
jgi:predicted dehydrogenase